MRRRALCLLFTGALLMSVLLAAQQASETWVKFEPPDKSFSVLMPGEPTYGGDKGEHHTNAIWLWAVRGERVFLAGYTDYDFVPDLEPELIANRDNFLKGVNAKLTTSKRIEFERAPGDKLPAMEFTGENETYNFKGLIIMDGGRPYMFCVGGRGNLVAATDKFLNSIQLRVRRH